MSKAACRADRRSPVHHAPVHRAPGCRCTPVELHRVAQRASMGAGAGGGHQERRQSCVTLLCQVFPGLPHTSSAASNCSLVFKIFELAASAQHSQPTPLSRDLAGAYRQAKLLLLLLLRLDVPAMCGTAGSCQGHPQYLRLYYHLATAEGLIHRGQNKELYGDHGDRPFVLSRASLQVSAA